MKSFSESFWAATKSDLEGGVSVATLQERPLQDEIEFDQFHEATND